MVMVKAAVLPWVGVDVVVQSFVARDQQQQRAHKRADEIHITQSRIDELVEISAKRTNE